MNFCPDNPGASAIASTSTPNYDRSDGTLLPADDPGFPLKQAILIGMNDLTGRVFALIFA